MLDFPFLCTVLVNTHRQTYDLPQDSLEFTSQAPDPFMRAMRKATGGWIRYGLMRRERKVPTT